jgi:hypothetical protein
MQNESLIARSGLSIGDAPSARVTTTTPREVDRRAATPREPCVVVVFVARWRAAPYAARAVNAVVVIV